MKALGGPRPTKRLFLGLSLAACILSALGVYAIWRVSAPGLAQLHFALPVVLGLVLAAFLGAVMLGIAATVLGILGLPVMRIVRSLAWWALNLLFPIVTLLGRVFDINRQRIERSFIEVSNQLVRQRAVRIRGDRLLILSPHCVQFDRCLHRVTVKPDNCRQCGHCAVGGLLALAHKYGAHLAVVPGGTLARKVIKSLRPQAVLAVACERDLVAGVQDVFPLPVIGILNQRPQGPCCNTTVDLDRVEEAILQLVG